MKKQMHRLLSLMLGLILVVGMIPGSLKTAHAASASKEFSITGSDWNVSINAEGIISWDAQPGATQYNLKFYDNVMDAYPEIPCMNIPTNSFDLKAEFEKRKIEHGELYFLIEAQGVSSTADAGNVPDMMIRYVSAQTKLSEPHSVEWDGKKATWDSVSNATGYKVTLYSNNGYTQVIRENVTSTEFNFEENGNTPNDGWWFTVQATRDGYRNSNAAESPKYGEVVTLPGNTIINSVNLTDFAVPSAGDNTSAGDPVATAESGKGYTFAYGTWFKSDGSNQFTGTFEAGETYNALLAVRAEDGYEFDPTGSFSATVKDANGNTLTIKSASVGGSSRANDTADMLVEFTVAENVTPPGNTIINSVSLTGFNVPSDGDNTSAGDPVATAESGKGYTFAYGTWLKSDGSNQFTGTFEAGETYNALLAVRAEDGYEFDPTGSFSATVKDANGNTLTVKSVSVGGYSRANDTATVVVEFTVAENVTPPGNTIINSVNLTDFAVPSAGVNSNSVNPTVTAESDKGYDIYTTYWCDKNGTQLDTTVFEAGNTYYARFVLLAKDGYQFSDSPSVTVNGNGAYKKNVSNHYRVDDCLSVTVQFTVNAAPVIPTEINISKLPSLTVGDKITKAMAKNVFPAGLTFIGNTPYVAVINSMGFIGQPTEAKADTNYYLYGTWELKDYTEIPDASQYVVKYNGTALTYTPNNLLGDNEQSGYYFYKSNNDGKIYCNVWIYLGKAAPAVAPTEITDVNATVAEPVVGGTPSTVATTTGTDYTVFVSGWYDEEENTVSVFEAGKTYTLEVGFTPKEGYVLAGSKTLNATINDKEAEYLSLNTINGTVTCFIRYTIPAVVPTEYDITVTGGTASANKAVAGTVITLTVDESAIPAGKVFDKWEVVSGGVTITDGKFTMPANAVEINATYKDAPVSHTCDIKPVAKDEPSCTEDGKEAYYKCEGCGKFYEDALGAKEITDLANWGNLPKLGHTESDWKSDKDNHWKECTVTACGVIIEDSKAAHKDDNKDGKCDVCEYNVGIPTTPDEDKPNDTPQTGDNSMIWLLIALLFVSGAGVVATTVYGKKKFSVK